MIKIHVCIWEILKELVKNLTLKNIFSIGMCFSWKSVWASLISSLIFSGISPNRDRASFTSYAKLSLSGLWLQLRHPMNQVSRKIPGSRLQSSGSVWCGTWHISFSITSSFPAFLPSSPLSPSFPPFFLPSLLRDAFVDLILSLIWSLWFWNYRLRSQAQLRYFVLYDKTFPGETLIYIYSPQIGNPQQSNIWIPPRLNMVNQ